MLEIRVNMPFLIPFTKYSWSPWTLHMKETQKDATKCREEAG